jgi:dephospho-CoA kinase
MLRIGLTGGIGSGKTVVSDRLAELGIPVIDTDVLAREVVEPGEPTLDRLAEMFGNDILQADGRLDRERLRALVFSNPGAKKRLESIMHPAIRDKLQKRAETLESPYCVIVVPLLVETNFQEMVDRVLVVDAPREQRIRWVMERNGMTRSNVEQIMESQASSEERARVADDIIDNDGTLEELRRKVDRLHAEYLAAADDTGRDRG